MSNAITAGELIVAGSLFAWVIIGSPTATAVGLSRVAPPIVVSALAAFIALRQHNDSALGYGLALIAAATWLVGVVGLTLDFVVNALRWKEARQRPHLVRAFFDALAVAFLTTLAALHWY